MSETIILNLFLVLIIALLGGFLARLLKFPPLIGFILAGVAGGAFLSPEIVEAGDFAEIGVILLLFSIGLEMSFTKIKQVFKVGFVGAGAQILAVTMLGFIILTLFGVNSTSALVLSLGFSLSSTAVVVKILADNGELDTIHGELMIGWLLFQDLAVIPMMVILPFVGKTMGMDLVLTSGRYLLQAALVMVAIYVIGRLVTPRIIHKVAAVNSRELLILSAVALALGTATLTSVLGISPALGAFLAGVVIAESQENHAIFAETRPLRDIFVALFFVSLGFLVKPELIINNLPIVLTLALVVILIKLTIVLLVSLSMGYRGKTVIAAALGLSQIGEFAFVIFSQGKDLGILSEEATSIGIATAIVSLVVTPFLFKGITPTWRKFKHSFSRYGWYRKFLAGSEMKIHTDEQNIKNHIIICGYGRVGAWIGKALDTAHLPFVVIDYRQEIVNKLKAQGCKAIYGDCGELDVIRLANLESAKAVIVAIPDRIVQEEIITYVQNTAPEVKIIARAHLDDDLEKLKQFKVNQVVQPEFEAAVTIIKNIFSNMGKSKEEIAERVRNLRLSRSYK